MDTLINNILLAFYILIGLFFLAAAIESWRDQSNSARWGTGLFWLLFAVLFCAGQWLPNAVNGCLIVIIALLSLFKQVRVGHIKELDEKLAQKTVNRIGNWIFLPSILLQF